MKPNKIVGLIPARGGSKRIPMKNIKKLDGKPLIGYIIEAALKSKIDEVWVSTDHTAIKNVALGYGVNVLDRPSELSQDTSQTEEAIEHFTNNVDYDILVLLEATYPLTDYNDIDRALEIQESNHFDSVISLEDTVLWVWEQKHRMVEAKFDLYNRPRAQDSVQTLIETGGIFITKRSNFLQTRCRVSGRKGYYEMPHFSIDIDDQKDFEHAELLIKNHFR